MKKLFFLLKTKHYAQYNGWGKMVDTDSPQFIPNLEYERSQLKLK